MFSIPSYSEKRKKLDHLRPREKHWISPEGLSSPRGTKEIWHQGRTKDSREQKRTAGEEYRGRRREVRLKKAGECPDEFSAVFWSSNWYQKGEPVIEGGMRNRPRRTSGSKKVESFKGIES